MKKSLELMDGHVEAQKFMSLLVLTGNFIYFQFIMCYQLQKGLVIFGLSVEQDSQKLVLLYGLISYGPTWLYGLLDRLTRPLRSYLVQIILN